MEFNFPVGYECAEWNEGGEKEINPKAEFPIKLFHARGEK
jgi:hypothetical protein